MLHINTVIANLSGIRFIVKINSTLYKNTIEPIETI